MPSVPQADLQALIADLYYLDTRGTGRITVDELRQLLAGVLPSPSPQAVGAVGRSVSFRASDEQLASDIFLALDEHLRTHQARAFRGWRARGGKGKGFMLTFRSLPRL